MEKLPILQFEPLYKATVWGGRRLETVLGADLPGDGPFGESWEIVDLPDDQSVVSSGPMAGRALGEIRAANKRALLGDAPLLGGRFPLLLKFLDADKTLSVQVHPDAQACARIGGSARPKTEAWYIIDSEPGALLYVGLKQGVGRQALEAGLENGSVKELLNETTVRPGDFIFLPSGTVHAIGGGIMLAEVQQSSDTTYRVFDWNRVGLDGKPRKLHVEEALESIAFGSVGLPPGDAPPSGRPGLACEHFVMESLAMKDGDEDALEASGTVAIMGVAGDGEAQVSVGHDAATLRRGRTLMIPAERNGDIRLSARGGMTLLAVRVPA